MSSSYALAGQLTVRKRLVTTVAWRWLARRASAAVRRMGCGASTAAPAQAKYVASPVEDRPSASAASAAAGDAAASLGLEGSAAEEEAAAKMQAVQRGRQGREKAAEAKSAKQQVEKELARAKKKFEQMDKDGNGTIEGDELGALAKWLFESFHPGDEAVPPEVIDKEAAKLKQRLDKDSNGKLDFDEFAAWFTRTCAGISKYRKNLAQKKKKTQVAQSPAPAPAHKTDIASTKSRTKGALLGGLRSGALEKAVGKMEEDVAAEEAAAEAEAGPEF